MAKNTLFKAQIKKFAKLSAKTANEEVRKVALVGLSGVIEKTPVDQGVLKGNWNVGIDSADLSIDKSKQDKEGSSTYSEGGAVIGRFKNGDDIMISNNMPYANRIEHGYSPKSSGMIRRTFAELKGWIRSRRKKV
jgi:hypothetical protein